MAAQPFKLWKHGAEPNQVRVGSGTNQMVGHVRNFSDGAIQLLVPDLLREKADVTVTFTEDCVLEGKVLYCNHQDGAYRAGIYFEADPERRRKQSRYATPDEPVKVCFLGSRQSSVNGWVVDISKSGVGLKLTNRISLGEWVKLEMKSAILFGEIRHCRQETDGTFRAGVEIETAISSHHGPDSNDSPGSDEWIAIKPRLID
jgi:hypothetical protein